MIPEWYQSSWTYFITVFIISQFLQAMCVLEHSHGNNSCGNLKITYHNMCHHYLSWLTPSNAAHKLIISLTTHASKLTLKPTHELYGVSAIFKVSQMSCLKYGFNVSSCHFWCPIYILFSLFQCSGLGFVCTNWVQ